MSRIPSWIVAAGLSGCVMSTTPYERRFDELLTPPDVPTPEDTDLPPVVTCHLDIDADGFGSGPALGEAPCTGATVEGDDDCDDERADIHPGAVELCDGDDQACDGGTDAGTVSWNGTAFDSLAAALDAYTYDVDSPDPAVSVCGGPGEFGAHALIAALPDDLVLRGRAVAGQLPVITASAQGPVYAGSGTLELSDVAIVGTGTEGCLRVSGTATLSGVELRGCTATSAGGALFVGEAASVSVSGGRFEGNSATRGGAVAVASGGYLSGGGSAFVGKTADHGGAVHNAGTVYLYAAEVSDNAATESGGAMWSSDGLDVSGVFEGNQAPSGSAVRVIGGYAYLSGSFTGNGSGTQAAVFVDNASLYPYALEMSDQGTAVQVGANGWLDLYYSNASFSDNELALHQSALSGTISAYNTEFTGNTVDILDALGQSWTGQGATEIVCDLNGCTVY